MEKKRTVGNIRSDMQKSRKAIVESHETCRSTKNEIVASSKAMLIINRPHYRA